MICKLRGLTDSCMPSELVLRIWRFVCCAWCRTARFAREVEACHFCDAFGMDRQLHCASCDVTGEWLARMGFADQPIDEEIPAWLILGCAPEARRAVRMAAALDALASALDADRHGNQMHAHALCVARLKKLGRRHAIVREAAGGLCEASGLTATRRIACLAPTGPLANHRSLDRTSAGVVRVSDTLIDPQVNSPPELDPQTHSRFARTSRTPSPPRAMRR